MSDLETLRADRNRFAIFALTASDLLVEVGTDGRIAYAAGAAGAMTGRPAAALLGQPLLAIIHPSDRPTVTAAIARLTTKRRLQALAVRLDGGAGSDVRARLHGYATDQEAPKFYIALSSVRAAGDSDDADAGRDELTGLRDLDSFAGHAAAMAEAAAARDEQVRFTSLRLIGMADLINRLGAEAGRSLFGTIGGILRSHSLDGDAAGRLGENGYGILHDASITTQLLASAIQATARDVDPSRVGLTVDAQGMQLAGDLGQRDLAKALGYAIRRFAEDGTSRWHTAEESFASLLAETVSRVADYRATVVDNRFTFAFQPIVDLKRREVHHYELLARFGGGESPFETIAFAESVGLIEEFDLAICRQAVGFLAAPEQPETLRIAVNVSGRSLQNSLFVASLLELLKQHSPPASRLLFEVTESAAITDLTAVGGVIGTLRGLGYKVCLDDFGAGAAAFTYLQALNVDYVKIDGSYVRRMLGNRRDAVIIRAIVGMCRSLGIGTVAEMIEQEAQVRPLVELGVQYGQGYLFGHPGPVPQPPVPPRRLGKAVIKRQSFLRR